MPDTAFWKRTVTIFAAAPVTITLESGTELVGEVVFIEDDSCTIKRPDGHGERVYYSRIRQVVEAVPRL